MATLLDYAIYGPADIHSQDVSLLPNLGSRELPGAIPVGAGCQCFQAPCDCADVFDRPVFRTETQQLDLFRLAMLGLGILIGVKALR